jgi:hypothetical protein
MQKFVATVFDGESWDKHGLPWVRAAKSTGYHGLIIDNGLSEEAKSKVLELKFRLVPQGSAKTRHFAALVDSLKEGEQCFLCPVDHDFKSADLDSYFAGPGLVCACEGEWHLPNAVLPIANIYRRADATRLIEEKVIPVYGSTLDTRLMCGDLEAWAGFVGYYNFLLHSAFLEAWLEVDRMALNLYAAHFPGRVRV